MQSSCILTFKHPFYGHRLCTLPKPVSGALFPGKYCADRPVRREKFFRKVTQPHGAVVSLRRAAACQKEDFFPSVRGHRRVPG